MSAPNKADDLRAFHLQWNAGAPITDQDEKHRFTQAFAESLAQSDPRWGRKSRADGAGPLSKDTLGYWLGPLPLPAEPTDGQIDARDIIMSSGQTYWGGEGSADFDNIYARWYPVATAPAPQPDPPPADDNHADSHAAMVEQIGALTELANEFLAEADRLNAAIAASNTRLDDIERRLAELAKPKTYAVTVGRQWGHSHPASFTLEL